MATIVKTRVGEITCPDVEDIGPRTKFWAEAVQELARTEELYCVMAAAIKEALEAGRVRGIMAGIQQLALGDVIDVEGEVVDAAECVEAGDEECSAEGSEPAKSDAPSDGSGSAEPST